MGKYEHELCALEDAGLDDVETDAALTFVLEFVRGAALAGHAARGARDESGMTDEEWWEANAPLLARLVDPGDYPTAARVGTAAGEAQRGAYSAEHAWEFGLERVLDGLQVLVDRRAAARTPGA